ncbi:MULTISPECIES: sensor domain-containing phosphodiesterase [unclassified Pseudomonas]|uniref:sensor domain-containing phosphodiesterase n=1 Tax=unclassified Pseudomonas TaxID=196821 RepID=UPI0025FB02F8|nr:MULTISPECIES: sensor domain-containing phosphodiesterase [unclassified Pseudomonas]
MQSFSVTFDERARLAEVDRLTADLPSGSDPVLNSIVAMISTHFGVATALVSIVDRDFQVFKAKVGLSLPRTSREVSFCAHGLDSSDILEVCDTHADSRFADNPLVSGAPFIRYYAGAPLVIEPGLALGGLCVIDKAKRAPMSAQDKVFLQNAAELVVARLQSIHSQHFFDAMTGLPNRQRFELDVNQLNVPSSERAALLIEPLSAMGMDRLAKSLGLDFFADFMLAVKELLLGLLPPGATLYRTHTLCFTILADCHTQDTLPRLLDSITEALGRPVNSKNVPVVADVGIGVLKFGPDAQLPIDSLRLMASITEAARKGSHRWLHYDPAIDASLRRSVTLLNSIEAALLAPDQLRLVYQPRVDLGSNRCASAEALLRWAHPTLGEVGPAEFIGLAETTASIRHITRWVVRHVCEQLAQWRRQGLTMTVSLNVSALDLTDAGLFDELCQALDTYDIAPEYLELEFTENVLVTDFAAVREQLLRLRRLGVAVGIDDFGSGYSNWTYLRQIPATSVKLDRSLLADLQPGSSDWHIVRGLISLAKDLNLTVVAEGIETELHYHLLRGWGCHEGQGYYFAKPLAPDHLVDWLSNGSYPPMIPMNAANQDV